MIFTFWKNARDLLTTLIYQDGIPTGAIDYNQLRLLLDQDRVKVTFRPHGYREDQIQFVIEVDES